MTRSIKKWSDEADAKLQDCFASTDWNMFRGSSNGIEEYTTSAIAFINKCIDDIIPTVTVHTFPNQKPWITGNIHTELEDRAAMGKLVKDSGRQTYQLKNRERERQAERQADIYCKFTDCQTYKLTDRHIH